MLSAYTFSLGGKQKPTRPFSSSVSIASKGFPVFCEINPERTDVFLSRKSVVATDFGINLPKIFMRMVKRHPLSL